jgi:uncharacterized protein YybS (DUF2232 family)
MTKKITLKVTGVRASTVAMFEGTLAAVFGLAVAILFSLGSTVSIAESTNSVLTGFAFGIGAGIVSIIVLPLIYFGIGWIVGYVHGWIFNAVLKTSGGIAVDTEQ